MLQSCSWLPDQQANGTCCVQGNKLTPVGFEPTPLRNGALSHRLRPLGQTVMEGQHWYGRYKLTELLFLYRRSKSQR